MEMIILMTILIAMMFGLVIEYLFKKARLYRYEEIELGMNEEEVIDLMGFNYSKNLLNRGKTKYEWRLNGFGFIRYGIFNWAPTKSVEVYIKNGKVYKVLTNNM